MKWGMRGLVVAATMMAAAVAAQTSAPTISPLSAPTSAPTSAQPSSEATATPAAPATATVAQSGPVPVTTLENRRMTATALIPLLQRGGLIVLIRHERTEVPSRADDYSRPITDCMAQRNLSVAGVAGAVETGTQLRLLDIPVDAVLSSEMCRAMDTARLMFGRVSVEPRLLHHDNVPERTVIVSGTELNALMAQTPLGAGNVMMVSHIGNIFFATGMRLTEGEMGVIRRNPDGTLVILGQIIPNELGAITRQMLMERTAAPTTR